MWRLRPTIEIFFLFFLLYHTHSLSLSAGIHRSTYNHLPFASPVRTPPVQFMIVRARDISYYHFKYMVYIACDCDMRSIVVVMSTMKSIYFVQCLNLLLSDSVHVLFVYSDRNVWLKIYSKGQYNRVKDRIRQAASSKHQHCRRHHRRYYGGGGWFFLLLLLSSKAKPNKNVYLHSVRSR